MLQSTDPRRLSNKEGSRVDTWISLGRGRIEFIGGLGVGGDGNMKDRARMGGSKGESIRRDGWNWGILGGCSGNLWNL